MSLSSAKAKLDAQGGDPVTGYISKTDHQESYDELVDDTALTGATTAEAITVSGAAVAGTLNGRDPDDLVKGPASATDNALVRFDGTGGKTVQNSGITVDDSGYITSALSHTSTLSIRDSSTGNLRWKWNIVGSLLYLTRHNDAGTAIADPLAVSRTNGQVTLGEAGASGGLVLGASGPRVMSGTGSPEGVVTAPVGSTWIDTAATTGAIKWVKASGTGNTGWVVEYGDTGIRDIAASIANSWTVSPHLHLRRTGNIVTLYVRQLDGAAASATTFVTLPTGFRPAYDFLQFPVSLTGSAFGGYGAVYSTGEVVVFGTSSACTGGRLEVTFATSNAWPSSLPGSAA